MNESQPWFSRDLTHFYYSTGEDIFDIHEHYANWFTTSQPAGYYLYELSATSAPGTKITLTHQATNDAPLINLASYNYLGLAQRPEVIEASIDSLRRYGLGAAGSSILSGQLSIHDDLCRELADFKGVDDVLLFPSGYSANVGVISALAKPGDHILTDLFAHASIVDGAVLSRAQLSYFQHNNLRSLERKLAAIDGRVLVIVEGVYSMDGDVAPLPGIAELCQRYGARLMVDEAHSAFIFGDTGRGIAEHFGMEQAVDVQLGTLSKSLGGIGGYVGGSAQMLDYLRAFARSHMFSCALAPPVVGGLLAALRILRAEPELRSTLWHNVDAMRTALQHQGVDTGNSSSQIIPIMVNDDVKIFPVAEELMREGVFLNPIRYPAVKLNRSRLRVSISALHDPVELEQSAQTIAKVLRSHEVIS